MKKLIFVFIVFSSCIKATKETYVDSKRELDTFHELVLKGSYTVELKKSDRCSVIITTKNDAEDIIATVDKDVLSITDKRNSKFDFGSGSTTHVTVYHTNLSAISIEGSGDISGDAGTGDRLKITISGSGDIQLTSIDTKCLDVFISGSGDIKMSGRAIVEKFMISGAGDIDASALAADTCMAMISGAGDVKVSVKKLLDAKISGTGDISYIGEQVKVVSQVSGWGEINRTK